MESVNPSGTRTYRPTLWLTGSFSRDERTARMGPAVDAGCDFPGFGLHSFRRANITMRQEEGGSAIEASKIAGHATVSQTGDYTIVQLQRQDELTRAIQGRMADSRKKQEKDASKRLRQTVEAAG